MCTYTVIFHNDPGKKVVNSLQGEKPTVKPSQVHNIFVSQNVVFVVEFLWEIEKLGISL